MPPPAMSVRYVLLLCFFTGPENPWLVSLYGRYAPHPFGSVVGEEIFQSGIIPGETDFRIFRDYGGLPGKVNSFVLVVELYPFIID